MNRGKSANIGIWCIAAILGFICIYSSCTYLSTGLREKASVYTGGCVGTYSYRKEGGKYQDTLFDFVIQMDNGQEYWVSDALCAPEFLTPQSSRKLPRMLPLLFIMWITTR